MKDIVVKTVLITLASLLGVIMLVFGALAIFSPITLAKVFDGTGGYSSSIRFYEKHYEKTGDVEDLATLALKINQDIDAQLAEECFEALVSHKDFEAFCAGEQGDGLSNKEFYIGKYAIALVKNDKLNEALAVAEDFVSKNGYTKYNPYTMLIISESQTLSDGDLSEIKAKIEKYKGEGEKTSNADIEYLDKLLTKE